MSNPLLEAHELPPFSQFQPEQVEPAMDEILSDNRQGISALLSGNAEPTWQSLIAPMETLQDRLDQAWSPVSHLNAVCNSDALREVYNRCLPKLSEYHTELGQNRTLFDAYRQLAESADFAQLPQERRQLVNHALRDFRLSGIDLDAAGQARYGELKKRLSELTSRFSENVLDATQGWTKLIEDPAALAGLPDSALAAAEQAAKARQLDGYLVTLEFPSYLAVMTYCDNPELRNEVYTAFCTRASDQGPQAGQWDNSPLIDEILHLRHELAQLLGYDNYAAYSLATKMAETPDQVVDFLRDLGSKSLPVARQEFLELQDFAREQFGVETLQAWDLAYYSEKLRQARYDLSQEALRPYFPLPRVLAGLFEIAGKLFDIQIQEQSDFESWHADARFFRVKRHGKPLGAFYLDPCARANKRGGAWMDECRVRRRREDGSLQLPVAYLVCNFNPPVGDQPALLTHQEVTTLFHEFGHGLHHLLTQVECAAVSGINGVAWDAVELPSQFLENWCWQPEALALMSGHVDSGEPLPQALLERLMAAKNFQAGMQMVRQLEFALFDLLLHRDYCPAPKTDVQALLDKVRREVSVVIPPAYNRFQHGFSHIFAGGYAAGYYSYKWAEVLAADAFGCFEEEGIFNEATGQRFLQSILEQGGSQEPMVLFKAFRGREPQVEALLRQNGILSEEKSA